MLPIVIIKQKEAYLFWQKINRNLPKTERFNLGQKISQSFIEVLELTFTAAYQPPEKKIKLLEQTLSRLDILKFFLQLAWEAKLIPNNQYTEIFNKLNEVGRMLGGWKNGLIKKDKPSHEKCVRE